MKLIRVFPRCTSHTPIDAMAFVGNPPLERPLADEVHVSCAFTWDKPRAEYLAKAWGQYYPVIKVGGPAFDSPVNGFVPGQYVKAGIFFTSRGCNNHCPWCLVPIREGRLQLLPITEGNVLQDNNWLQCPIWHFDKTCEMLSHQKQIILSGGLESALLKQAHVDRLKSLAIAQMFFACDTKEALKPLMRAGKLLALPEHTRKLRCYVLLKHREGETISEATERLENVWHAGFIPFAQLYQPPDKFINYPDEWKQLARTWSRPASIVSVMSKPR